MKLAIFGASARAAAFSAIAAGHEVVAADLFADSDLAERCEAYQITSWSDDFIALIEGTRAAGWLYTGGLENHPQIISDLAERCRLFGTTAAALGRLRDPFALVDVARSFGVAMPLIRREPPTGETAKRWLAKPLQSAGGLGIDFWRGNFWRENGTTTEADYFQQYIEDAQPIAATFAVASEGVLLGITRQLVGEPWTGAEPFAYCGSLLQLGDDWSFFSDCLSAIGDMLVALGARGVVGVDMLVRDGECWLIEINPRYPASAELIEHQRGESMIGIHVNACNEMLPRTAAARLSETMAKAVLFAHRKFTVNAQLHAWLFEYRLAVGGDLADIPTAETRIALGEPILTALTTNESDPLSALQARFDEIRTRIDYSML